MLVVKDAILAEGSNSGVGSGLLVPGGILESEVGARTKKEVFGGERSLPEEERVQVWFSVRWISLLSYSFGYDF